MQRAEAGVCLQSLGKSKRLVWGEQREQVQSGLKSPRRVLFFLRLFFMWTIFKIFIEFITILPVLCFVILAMNHVGSKFPTKDRTHTSCIGR